MIGLLLLPQVDIEGILILLLLRNQLRPKLLLQLQLSLDGVQLVALGQECCVCSAVLGLQVLGRGVHCRVGEVRFRRGESAVCLRDLACFSHPRLLLRITAILKVLTLHDHMAPSFLLLGTDW